MLRKIATLALAAGLVGVASQALAFPVLFGGNKNLPERPYDLAKAKQLLADAGYPKGFEIDWFVTRCSTSAAP